MKNFLYFKKNLSIFFVVFFLFLTQDSYAAYFSLNKVGIHDYTLSGSISSSELTLDSKNITRRFGVQIYYNTPYWANGINSGSLGKDCPNDKAGAAQVINSVLGKVYLKEAQALYNYQNSYVSIDCRIEGGNNSSWHFSQYVSPPVNTGGKGCRVNAPYSMNFGTVQQGMTKAISSGMMVYCDKDSYLSFSFQSDTPGILTMGDTIIKYGFSESMSPTSSSRISSGGSTRKEFVLQLVDTGSQLGLKNGSIIMVVNIQ